jgi:hypothetical protein
MDKQDILKIAAQTYYVNPDMVKFLLIENLALKTLLHEKGLITPEEYQACQDRAAEILELKERSQMIRHLQSMMSKTTQDLSVDNTQAEVREKCNPASD